MRKTDLGLGIAGIILGFILVLVTKAPALVVVIFGSGCAITAFTLGMALGERNERGRQARELWKRQQEAMHERWPWGRTNP